MSNGDKPHILLVGYGNPSRTDDGVGWYVAHHVSERLGDRIDIETCHQIEIDLAETIPGYDLVILVDAHVSDAPEGWIRNEVEPAYSLSPSSHHFTPATLLAISEALYGCPPSEMVLYTIKAHDLNFGEHLSSATQCYADEVVNQICAEIESALDF